MKDYRLIIIKGVEVSHVHAQRLLDLLGRSEGFSVDRKLTVFTRLCCSLPEQIVFGTGCSRRGSSRKD